MPACRPRIAGTRQAGANRRLGERRPRQRALRRPAASVCDRAPLRNTLDPARRRTDGTRPKTREIMVLFEPSTSRPRLCQTTRRAAFAYRHSPRAESRNDVRRALALSTLTLKWREPSLRLSVVYTPPVSAAISLRRAAVDGCGIHNDIAWASGIRTGARTTAARVGIAARQRDASAHLDDLPEERPRRGCRVLAAVDRGMKIYGLQRSAYPSEFRLRLPDTSSPTRFFEDHERRIRSSARARPRRCAGRR